MSEKKMTKPVQHIINRAGIAGECAPSIMDGHGVCSSPKVIDELRNWLKLSENASSIEVIEEAKERTGCETEVCLYRSPYVKSVYELDERFKPAGPWNSSKWLNNINIDQVIESWRPRFKLYHVPFQMIDFYDYDGELASLDFMRIVSSYDSLCCVVNTDPRGKSGKHWICIYIDIKRGTVEYFDSAGQETPPSILRFITETAIELTRLTGKKYMDIQVTSMQHQMENTECGLYCLFYILARLVHIPYSFFQHTRVPDSDMSIFRSYVFRQI
jgi:hypothetical protein